MTTAPDPGPLARRALLAHLRATPAGWPVSADTWRHTHEPAQLTSAEIGGAMRWATHRGYLDPVYDGGHQVAVPSTHPPAKGRRVLVYERTVKAVPREETTP